MIMTVVGFVEIIHPACAIIRSGEYTYSLLENFIVIMQ